MVTQTFVRQTTRREEEILVAKLCDAAISGDVGLCRKLLRRGVNPVAGDVDGRTPVHLAAAAGKTDILQLFIEEEKVNVNVTDNWGNTCIRDVTVLVFGQ
jgi:ankyrin repeat protein